MKVLQIFLPSHIKVWDTLSKQMSVSKGLRGPRFRGSKSSKLAAASLGCVLAQLHICLQQGECVPCTSRTISWRNQAVLTAPLGILACQLGFHLVGSWIGIMQCLSKKPSNLICKYTPLQASPYSKQGSCLAECMEHTNGITAFQSPKESKLLN